MIDNDYEINIPNGWKNVIEGYTRELSDAYYVLKKRKETHDIYPPLDKMMKFLYKTPLDKCSVVIVGQEPYSNSSANGVAFSVDNHANIPPSLRNVFIEVEAELGRPPNTKRDLEHWTNQGVLLLNTALTVEVPRDMKHDILWYGFIRRCIKACSNKGSVVFLLWGMDACSFERDIDLSRNIVLKTSHPSPHSAQRGFFGCEHFVKTNNHLEKMGLAKIDW